MPTVSDINNIKGSTYYNARSIFPKIEELSVSISISSPDVVCIVESWLDYSIDDSELSIPEYILFHRDRNRHGGGLLIFVHEKFNSSLHFCSDTLEFFAVKLALNNQYFFIGLLYSPPQLHL